MKCVLKIMVFLLAITAFNTRLAAQQKDSSNIGSIKGTVKDTLLNYYLQAASVSVYNYENKLIAYSLTNSYGEFIIKGLPINIPLELRISFVGYKTYLKRFEASSQKNEVNAGQVILQKKTGLLDNVIVTPPPVRMNHDTLEFSAQAFTLDKNAVAEDLLRKLPGVIVWGDGTITVNGRQINKLLVDGKPFLTGDNKVATQNIPKSAIDKVQVYQEFIDPNNPYDSLTSINFKLRKTMHNGFFGVVSAGIGTNETYQSVVNLNIFNPRNQLAIVGQSNNINKLGEDINTILKNNTFKGKGVKVEYQPDFNLPGINKQSSGGILFTHDFIPDFNQDKQDRLSINSFFNQFSNNTVKGTTILNFLDNDSALTQQINSSLLTDNTEFSLSSHYNKLKNYNSHFIEGDYNYIKQTGLEFLNSKTIVPGIGLASLGNRFDSSSSVSNKISFKAGINHQGFFRESNPKLVNWRLSYSLNAENGDTNRTALATLVHSTNTVLNENFNRRYQNNLNTLDQNLSFTLGDFGKILFKKSRGFSKLNIQFENELQFQTQKIDNFITDHDSVALEYVKNPFLTTSANYNELNESPGFRISRDFMDLLANRYQKDWRLELVPKMQFSMQRYLSPTHPFQNINRDFHDFVPNASASYTNFQYGEFVDRYELSFNSTYNLPTAEQLFNLPDSSNIYIIYVGNRNLVPSKNYELSFHFKHNSVSRKNIFFYGIKASVGFTRNYFADSIIIGKNGRNIYYNTNLNGHKYLNLNAFFNKALVTGDNQFQFNLQANAFLFRNPGYFQYQQTPNTAAAVSHIFMQSDSISFSYTYKDFFAVNFLQYFSFYNSRQEGFSNTKFNNSVTVSNIGISLNPTSKLNFNSNVSFNRTMSSGFASIKSTILNASLSYRFLPADNLELKIAGLDLLNQNKGIINYGNSYSYTHGTVNLLHQYFMATLSFYPRKFGKSKTREK